MNHWHVVAIDSRFLASYHDGNSFSVRWLQRVLADALAHVEAEGGNLDDYDRISALCEREIARGWRWATNETLKDEPPLRLAIIARESAKASKGGVYLPVAPLTHDFHKVVEVSDLVSALRERIDHKLDRDQWGETAADERWLVIPLDGGAAATQLIGSFDFGHHQHDFSGVEFSGIDETPTHRPKQHPAHPGPAPFFVDGAERADSPAPTHTRDGPA